MFVTGREAFPLVKKYAKANVHVCQIDVAALISPQLIVKELSKKTLSDFSLIVVPGYVKGDVSVVEKELGVKCVKGSKHAADIPLVMDIVDNIKLSSERPADDIIRRRVFKSVRRELDKALKSEKGLKIGKRNPVYLGTISKIIAEIPDAPLLKEKDIVNFAKHYERCGASIIDIGMLSGEDNSDSVDEIVRTVRRCVNLPVSIDTSNKKEIIAGVDAGVDLVLNIDQTNKAVVKSINVPIVVVPRNGRGVPPKVSDRVRLLEKIIKDVKKRYPVIADPLLQSINTGFIDSLEAYIRFRRKYPNVTMMMGAGNVTELTDADSIGINAVLAGMASELKVELIFTTEASVKTKGTVEELSQAIRLMYLSKKRKQPPKDLGIDMLYLKDKRRLESIASKDVEILAVKDRAFSPEKTSFRIYLYNKNIVVVCYLKGKPHLGFKGKSSDALYKEICSRELVGCEHAAYLGKELAKAGIALRIGKNYVQDEELFNKSYT